MGLYYLQSRYYDPELCRFLNADAFVSTGQGELGNNMFAYCRNNPVRRIDISGTADADLVDEDGRPLESEDIEKDAGAGVPGSLNANYNGGTANGGASNGNVVKPSSSANSNASNTANGSNPGNTGSGTALPQNGATVSSDQALDMAIDFLGTEYVEASPGRFVSADGLRQVRMGIDDLLGRHAGKAHVNFNLLSPKYKNVHVFFYD